MNNLANSYKTLYYYDKAQDLYLKIIKKDPLNLKTLNNYANLKRTWNDFDGAIDLYLKATKINPEEINILFSLADSYQSIGDFKKSREARNNTAKRIVHRIGLFKACFMLVYEYTLPDSKPKWLHL